MFVEHFKDVQNEFKNHVVFTSLQVDETDFGQAKKELVNGKLIGSPSTEGTREIEEGSIGYHHYIQNENTIGS